MSIYRRNAKSDASQPDLVEKLRKAGIEVWVIRRPCDLLLRFWCLRHRDRCWQPLECKTGQGKANTPRKRSDQKQQEKFLKDTDTPVAVDFDTAWRELNKRHSLGHIETPCVLKTISV